MTPSEYIKNVMVTESVDLQFILARLQDVRVVRLLHAMIGMCTETGEIQDALKKHIFYGKPLDEVNLKEEAGDLLWYVAILLDELGVSFEEVMDKNIAKLRARYGDKFTEAAALSRNLDRERRVLDNGN